MKRRKLLLQHEEIDLKIGFEKEAAVAVTLGRKGEDDNEIRVFFPRSLYSLGHWIVCIWVCLVYLNYIKV